MKPQDQTKFGYRNGDCFAACLATIAELDLKTAPTDSRATADEWNAYSRKLLQWLKDAGFRYVEFQIPADHPPAPIGHDDVLLVLSGPSPRGAFTHSVAGKVSSAGGFEVVHDPHPSRAGLAGQVKFVGVVVRSQERQL